MNQSRKPDCSNSDRPGKGMSKIRRAYFLRLVFRVLVFAACLLTALYWPREYGILHGGNFFRSLSPFTRSG